MLIFGHVVRDYMLDWKSIAEQTSTRASWACSRQRNSRRTQILARLPSCATCKKFSRPPQEGVFHIVVTDRFYSSVQLALQLLCRSVYAVGTVQSNNKAFSQEVKADAATRPRGVPRGSAKMTVAKCCPQLTAMLWWDRMAVHLIAAG
ncbi:hypothetical protein PI125_g22210 [Phytophthora idaei]|nr:hypothetical protein PI125_g22210 [Phytophthora idaei]KAG3131731.1 hypothetical protein PI126_g19938 [Phytophthora idaei]